MSSEAIVTLAAAILLLVLAHGVRAARWAFLFQPGQLGNRLSLLIGLGIGYAVNALVPLRIGEVIRGAVAARLNRIRFSYVMATVVAERSADLVLVALLIAASAGLAKDPALALGAAALFAGTALALVLLAILIHRSTAVRGAIWRIAGIFNDRIRFALCDFAWSAAEMLVGGALLRWRFLVGTIAMWSLYIASFALFGWSLGVPLPDVVAVVLQYPLEPLTVTMREAGAVVDQQRLMIFVFLPILLILIYGAAVRRPGVARAAHLVLRFGRSGRGSPKSSSDRFGAASAYESFLGALFRGDDRVVSGFGMEAIDDCIVHKFYAGGSDAITALVETNQRMTIRKFAVGEAAVRLQQQAEWLKRHAGGSLPLVEVVDERPRTSVYSYDMPLVTPTNDFYDVIHSSPIARNRSLLGQLLVSLDTFHRDGRAGTAEEPEIRRYLSNKVTRNAATITAFARRVIGKEAFRINGVDHNLAEWRALSDETWLLSQLRDHGTGVIHGDLTIENVIISPDQPAGLYIIDPNPENIFNSPLIDWAKLMQSLNLGYETLNRGISCELHGEAIQLATVRSQAYAQLHETLEHAIRDRFGDDGLREVYFHELVNYLRLTTYKIRQSETRGLGFFACTSLLLRRYRERWS